MHISDNEDMKRVVKEAEDVRKDKDTKKKHDLTKYDVYRVYMMVRGVKTKYIMKNNVLVPIQLEDKVKEEEYHEDYKNEMKEEEEMEELCQKLAAEKQELDRISMWMNEWDTLYSRLQDIVQQLWEYKEKQEQQNRRKHKRNKRKDMKNKYNVKNMSVNVYIKQK